MTFIPADLGSAREGNYIPGEGPKDAKIAIVGEAGGAHEDRHKRPFCGPAGRVLEQCMHSAGLIRGECYLTNVIKLRPRGNDIAPYYNSRTGTFSALADSHIHELLGELNEIKPNIIVATGNIPMAALTRRKKGVTKYRGYIEEGLPSLVTRKVLVTIHPSSTFFRGEGTTGGGAGKGSSPYIGRYYLSHDLRKAKRFSTTPELVRPERKIVICRTVEEVKGWLEVLAETKRVSLDIEVLNFELASIGLSADPSLAVEIPFADQKLWSDYEEAEIMRLLDHYIFGNSEVVIVVQNGIFDLWFLFLRYGILTRGEVEDTMIGHHVMYFEMAKGLDFLASIHCGAQEYWKDMVKFNNIKDNA